MLKKHSAEDADTFVLMISLCVGSMSIVYSALVTYWVSVYEACRVLQALAKWALDFQVRELIPAFYQHFFATRSL